MKFLLIVSLLIPGACALAESEPLTLQLWPDGPPSAMPTKSEATEKMIASHGGTTPTRLSDITDPTIIVYLPEKPNGAAVIVAPGGGFMFLSYSFEGTQVCEWLNSIGITAVLLKYRTPTRDDTAPFKLPVEDAQRALGIVRHNAREWGIDPQRVGLLGFSAGAKLAGHASWDRTPRLSVCESRVSSLINLRPSPVSARLSALTFSGGIARLKSLVEPEPGTASMRSPPSSRRSGGVATVIAPTRKGRLA